MVLTIKRKNIVSLCVLSACQSNPSLCIRLLPVVNPKPEVWSKSWIPDNYKNSFITLARQFDEVPHGPDSRLQSKSKQLHLAYFTHKNSENK